ncbi:MAG: hypothetical protein SGARI_002325, partial [Bacillariaceae sp.]
MKSVAQVADVISALVLPCYDLVEEVLQNDGTTSKKEDRAIVTSFLARPLAFVLARIHTNIKVYILNLQPTCPNKLFPNYRVSTKNFVTAVMKLDNERHVAEHTESTDAVDEDFIETYWKLEHALESAFLGDRMTALYEEKSREIGATSSSYFTWEDLQRILLGHNDPFVL